MFQCIEQESGNFCKMSSYTMFFVMCGIDHIVSFTMKTTLSLPPRKWAIILNEDALILGLHLRRTAL